MLELNEKTIRGSFINASVRERTNLTLPENFATLDWEELDFLGWRDRKYPELGYVVGYVDAKPTAILLRRAEAATRARPQCTLCEDVFLPNDVAFFNAKRAGKAGRNGNTVSTLMCAGFECSANVRRLPVAAYLGFDVEGARRERMATLVSNFEGFLRNLRDGV
ncbi:FBP domain-containing protein [Arthrobacter cryoconiti]|uniref:FBP domain-containing protein n=1 Tax=Arthrobacter cryoconiti TaxID=748907 RepID=A0ABV8R0I4_9MICC|nr:FBP domain-containing protein [Arthrobacter cryoconiti]MCC9068648.1 FBP domain-containing protein [Arthrobacter cryoconiti]